MNNVTLKNKTYKRIFGLVVERKCMPWRTQVFLNNINSTLKMHMGRLYDQKFFDSKHRKILKENSVIPVVFVLAKNLT